MTPTRCRAGTVALLTCAAVALPAAPASAAWQHAEVHVVEVQRVCRDGVQLQIARIQFPGAEPARDPVRAHLAVTDAPPEEPVPTDPSAEPPTRYPVEPENVILDRDVLLKQLKPARTIVTDDQQEFRVSHLKKAKFRFTRRLDPRKVPTVGISPADFAVSSGVLEHQVKRCRLFR